MEAGRVLIVDDELTNRKLLAAFVHKEGYETVLTASAVHALELLKTDVEFDAILTDVMMPQVDGIQFVELLRKTDATRHIPVILLTANVDQEVRLRGLQAGADDFLNKPVDRFELGIRLSNLVKLKNTQDALRERNVALQERVHEQIVELDLSREFLNEALDALSANIAILDSNGIIVAVNKAWRQFGRGNELGMPDSAVGSSYFDAMRDLDSGEIRRGMDSVMMGAEVEYVYEYPCHSPDRQRWFVLRCTGFGEGPARYLMVAHENITRRKLAEQAVQESEKLYRSIVETAPDNILVLHPQTRAIEFISNDGPTRSVSELTNASVWEFVSDECREDLEDGLKRAMASDQKDPITFHIMTPDSEGATRTFRCRMKRFDAQAGPRLLAVTTDISAQLEAEEALKTSRLQLQQAQKMEAVGALASGVAHDFNNLLSVIKSFGRFAAQSAEGAVKEDIEEVLAAADRGVALTRQLLAFSRTQVFRPRVTDLSSIVEEFDKMLRRLVGENIALRVEVHDSPNVLIDVGQFEQVVMNLVVNASDAIEGTGEIVIRLGSESLEGHSTLPDGRYASCAVIDTGTGIPADTMDRIFEPFFTTKAVGRGTGLGLATVYGIVTQSGGDVQVESEPDVGTKFTVYLPVETEAAVAKSEEASTRVDPIGNASILLVEDERAVREAVRRTLEGAGFEVHGAQNSGEAVLLLERGRPFDILLSDVIMPVMSGPELAERVREAYPEIRVLFMTGHADDPAIRETLATTPFLQKPFEPEEVVQAIQSLMRSHS